jgi:hypothetical protein
MDDPLDLAKKSMRNKSLPRLPSYIVYIERKVGITGETAQVGLISDALPSNEAHRLQELIVGEANFFDLARKLSD